MCTISPLLVFTRTTSGFIISKASWQCKKKQLNFVKNYGGGRKRSCEPLNLETVFKKRWSAGYDDKDCICIAADKDDNANKVVDDNV